MSVHMVAEDMALRLAEDEKRGPGTALVIQQFKKLLAAEPTLTPGARDYFDMLLAALEEPFLREESEGARTKSNSESGAAEPEVSIDDIFEGDV